MIAESNAGRVKEAPNLADIGDRTMERSSRQETGMCDQLFLPAASIICTDRTALAKGVADVGSAIS